MTFMTLQQVTPISACFSSHSVL